MKIKVIKSDEKIKRKELSIPFEFKGNEVFTFSSFGHIIKNDGSVVPDGIIMVDDTAVHAVFENIPVLVVNPDGTAFFSEEEIKGEITGEIEIKGME